MGNGEHLSTFRRARREATVAGILWACALTWTIVGCWWMGYRQPAHSIAGIPSWVLWGIILPWVTFFFLHCWYTLIYLRLGERGAPKRDPDS